MWQRWVGIGYREYAAGDGLAGRNGRAGGSRSGLPAGGAVYRRRVLAWSGWTGRSPVASLATFGAGGCAWVPRGVVTRVSRPDHRGVHWTADQSGIGVAA